MHKLTLSEIQQRELELLVKFDRICKENNLKYSLAYGTLIGAIRHNGFIPWDDDVDVLMPRGDYEKLLKIQYKDDECELRHFSFTNNYGYPFAKLVDKNTIINEPWRTDIQSGLFIDIFPFDYLDFNKGKQFERLSKKAIFYQFLISVTNIKPFYYRRPHYIIRSFIAPFVKPFRKVLLNKNDNLTKKAENGKYYGNIVYTELKKPILLDSELLKKTVEHTFENYKFSIMENFDYSLNSEYGDYMTPPPKEYQRNVHGLEAYYQK